MRSVVTRGLVLLAVVLMFSGVLSASVLAEEKSGTGQGLVNLDSIQLNGDDSEAVATTEAVAAEMIKTSEVEGDFEYYILTDGSVIITKYIGNGGKVTIPSMINGEPILSINDYVFRGNNSIVEVVIPNGVETISGDAFMTCTNLTKISLPKSIKNIFGNPVSDCDKLTEIQIDPANTSFKVVNGLLLNRSGDTLVACPAGKTSVVIPEGVTTIGISAFKGCDKLQSIQLPATLKTIASYAFRNCSSMPNITIPDNTTSIGHGAFVYCDKLENVSFGQGVTQISSLAFADCKSLKEVAFPANLTSLQEWDTFARCPQLAKVVIPETVKKIDYSNFSGSPLVKIYGKTNSFAQTYANTYSIPFVSLGIVEVPAEPALTSFIGKDLSGNYYKYQADDFNNAYLAYQYNPELTAAKMYQQFLNGKCKIIALEDAAKGYLDYDAAGSASLLAQINNQPFDLLAYFASADAKLLQETITNIKIVDKDGNTN